MKYLGKSILLLSLLTVISSCQEKAVSSDCSVIASSETSLSSETPSSETSSLSEPTSSSSELPSSLSVSSLSEYYSGVSGTGLALLESLREAISTPFTSIGYKGLWKAYFTTDSEDGVHVTDYYSNATNYTIEDKDTGSHTKEGAAWNREHTIPKSWWGGETTNQGCDIYIVVPTDGYVNERRSNYPFGETDGGTYASANGYSKLGASTREGFTGTCFEPNDEWKGDFARIYFYALTRWSSAATWTSGEGQYVFSGSYDTNFGLTDYALSLFLEWNESDPVSEYEIRKNDAAETIQGNRNPYVDNPSWIDDIWGS